MLAICSSKKLRFSDVFSMNDCMEMHWGYGIWELAASELINELGKEFLDEIDKNIHVSGLLGLPVISCLSLQGDVLSQWRAYADDGKGYAIGFRSNQLAKMPVRPIRVLYDKGAQIREVKTTVQAIHAAMLAGGLDELGGFSSLCFGLATDLAALKNPAFFEEQEVRLVHLLDLRRGNSSLHLVDEGGTAFGAEVPGEPVSFLIRGDTPAAFIDLKFAKDGEPNAIAEVVIGPKNHALPSGISIFLETLGLNSVKVRKSIASYR
ncbi:MAG: DUF2971 domain-containing protein [Holophagaceae bacterium]